MICHIVSITLKSILVTITDIYFFFLLSLILPSPLALHPPTLTYVPFYYLPSLSVPDGHTLLDLKAVS